MDAFVALKNGTGFSDLFFSYGLMSCRTGPLRVARPLRGVCTLFRNASDCGPPVGRKMTIPTIGRAKAPDLPRQVKKACERPRHAQWARPAGHDLSSSYRPVRFAWAAIASLISSARASAAR